MNTKYRNKLTPWNGILEKIFDRLVACLYTPYKLRNRWKKYIDNITPPYKRRAPASAFSKIEL
jgi:hypothetical protein